MEPPLLRLPQELLIRVASYLTTPELGHLRGVCKDVESRLFDSFAHEFFRKRQFLVEEVSLQTLVDISKHATLSKRINEVILDTAQYMDAMGPHQSPPLGGNLDGSMLVWSGLARDMLVEAFQNLPNLNKVGVRDYDGLGRYRDGERAKWRSYGHSLSGPWPPARGRVHPVWTLLLNALGISGANVTSMEVFLRSNWRLTDGAFDVVSGRMLDRVGPALSKLKRLMLSLTSDRVSHNGQSNVRLKRFLHHMPDLEHLRLNFDGTQSELPEWLALSPAASTTTATSPDHVPPIAFPNLTTLDLGMLSVEQSTLLRILARFDLQTFNLWKVTILVDKRATLKDEDSNPAATFLEKLATMSSMKNVERAMLGFLWYNGKDEAHLRAYQVEFPPPGADSAKKTRNDKAPRTQYSTVSFKGRASASSFTVWAQDMAGRAVVAKDPDPRNGRDSESSYSDEDSEGDEEDEEDVDMEEAEDEEDEDDA